VARGDPPPPIQGVLETGLYVSDMARSREFYLRLFGFPLMTGDERFCAFDVAGRDVLLLFLRGGTPRPIRVPGGVIPPHNGAGQLHFAFAIAAADLGAWEARLKEQGVEIESRVTWPRGGKSVYFRDPDENLLELVTPGLWANY
jgi:catechol 2,3-dioxygenase-like lactoylglutathione lyase family enzyme